MLWNHVKLKLLTNKNYIMIKSILDNDLYKFSMGYAYMRQYPNADGVFEFHDRSNRLYSEFTFDRIVREINKLSELRLSTQEFNWAVETMPYIPKCYWEWFKSFRYEPDIVKCWLDEENHLHITVEGILMKITLYEVPILAIISAVNSSSYNVSDYEILSRLDKKIELSNNEGLLFSEFGTRRRFSYHVQDIVIGELAKNARFCTGTSNVHFAMKYGLKPIGTVAHEWIMFHGANFGYRRANYEAYEAWIRTYDGALGIALSDTYTTNAFLKNFSLKQAKLFDGVRQDSGDECEFVDKVVARYKELGVNPMLKTIVFSNALDFPKYKKIADYCVGKIGMCCAGVGTNLTNDTGFPASNIVMKLMRCRMNNNQQYTECIKISDDKGKVMGDKTELQIANLELGLGINIED